MQGTINDGNETPLMQKHTTCEQKRVSDSNEALSMQKRTVYEQKRAGGDQ